MSDHPVPSETPGVAFYLSWEFHRSILAPVHDALNGECRCLLSNDSEEVIAFRPAILVLADPTYDQFIPHLPGTIFVFTRHGFASKRLWHRAFTGCDFACVSSPWVRQDLLRRGIRPGMACWLTGFLPMDAVFRTPRGQPPPGFPLDVSAGTRNLLYAPTHNPGLHSFPVIGAGWIPDLLAAEPGLNIIVKPHPVTAERNPEWMAAWRSAGAGSGRVLLVEDTHSDVYRFFPITDVLLTDVSSVAFYFLAMDRPIVMVDAPHPEAAGDDYDPEGPEWRWRDMAVTIGSAAELVPAVRRCLADPGVSADRRAVYRERMFGELTDGRACLRLADRIRALLMPEGDRPEWAQAAWNSVRLRETNATLRRELERSRLQAEALAANLASTRHIAGELLRRSPGIVKRKALRLWNLLLRRRPGPPADPEERQQPQA